MLDYSRLTSLRAEKGGKIQRVKGLDVLAFPVYKHICLLATVAHWRSPDPDTLVPKHVRICMCIALFAGIVIRYSA
jgi:hypothetical protein